MSVASRDACGALACVFAYPLDGLIACATLARADVRNLSARGVPVVLFNRQAAAQGVDCVGTDHAAATRAIAELLHAAGHRRLVCVGGPADAPVSRERVRGFVARLAELGIGDVPVLTADYSYAGASAFRAYAESAQRPDAVFCVNDQLAMGVIDACRYGLHWPVPDAVSVVGFDDVAEAGRPSYDLTTVRQQLDAMAGRAVAMLLARMDGKAEAPARVLVPGLLIRRGSARL